MGTGVETRAELERAWTWRPIAGCPGRSVLREAPRALSLRELGVEAAASVHQVEAAPDEVHVVALPDGGLISYRRGDGSWTHTLNTPAGFARKLAQLGIQAG